MPLVLTQNEKSAAGVVYSDKLGVSYEYPSLYRSLVKEGEQFVYYCGKRREDDSTQMPHYFGTGMIGKITQSDGLYQCAIVDYEPFDPIVPFKTGDRYLEPEANTKISREVGLHYRNGVRRIDQEAFDAICGQGLKDARKGRTKPKVKKLEQTKKAKANSASKVDKLALKLALNECRDRWPDAKAFVAAPGGLFSIAVQISKDDTHYVAVKATTEAEPFVRLTPDEVRCSKDHGQTYSLWVFYKVDTEARAARLAAHEGPITRDAVDLDAALHGGRMRTADEGKPVGPTQS